MTTQIDQERVAGDLERSILDSNIGCAKILDLNARLIAMNEPGRCLLEIDDFEQFQGRDWDKLWPEESRPMIRVAVDKAKAGGVGEFQGMCPTAKGRLKWWDVIVLPVRNAQGTIERLVAISRDITPQKQIAAELQASQERFRLVSRATNDAIWDWDLQSGAMEWSRNFQTIFGYEGDKTEPSSKYWGDRIHPDDRKRVLDSLDQSRQGSDELWTEEYRFRDGKGDYRYVLDRGYIQKDDTGTACRMVGAMQDVTEQRRIEEALEASERKFRALTEKSREVVSLLDASGKVTYTNPSIEQILGYTPEEFIRLDDPFALIHPDELPEVQQLFADLLKTPGMTKMAEFRYRHKNGDYLWFEGSVTNLLQDSAVHSVVSNFRNITARKTAEEALRDQNGITKDITDNATTGLVIMNAHQQCIFLNPAAEQIFGYRLKEVIEMDKPLHDIVHHTRPDGRHYPMLQCPIDRALPDKNQTQGEDIFVRPDGSFYPVAFTASPVVRDGHAIGTVVEVRDTTPEKEAELQIRRLNHDLEQRVRRRTEELTAANRELARSNSELEDFAYAASHDLQEPLRKITAFSGLLATDYADDLPPEAHSYITGLQKSSARMSQLIEDLLSYSRVATQSQPFQAVDLNLTMEEVVDDLQTRVDDTNAKITYRGLCTVEGDALQLRLLLQNLVSNALKYAKKDTPPRVKVSSVQEDGCCTLDVEDNGIGFKEEYRDKIFTIFQRLHGRGEYEGTGVGLAICKKIVERHGGEITASSQEGTGSTFTVKLPLKQT